MIEAVVPFGDPTRGIENIEADRASIADQSFRDVDILLLPTCPTIVPPVNKARSDPQALSPEHTAFANYYGLPAMSVPCGFDANGLPIGLQIVAKPWDETSVLQLAYQYQMKTKEKTSHPIA
jgi:aspartyl-tRNA(Asn)/glutamyl-tRNA(Gln) amidotransferase subunit A